MLQNNPNFTETKGTVKEQIANFNGMQETKIYNDAEKQQLQHDRPMDSLVASIYDVPNRRLVMQDLSSLNASSNESEKEE